MNTNTLTISKGNQKLGPIPNFSLPAIITCPGKTALCAKVCYANKGPSRIQSGTTWLKNFKRVRKEKKALLEIVRYCKAYRPKAFRVHVSGDFYSAAYVKAWIKVAKRCPNTVFFAYTRSWRVDKLRHDLETLKALPNVRLWASYDKFTGPAPINWKSAFMAMNDLEKPPSLADLVFRVSRKNITKWLFGSPVCPVENGTQKGKEIDCFQCGICFR